MNDQTANRRAFIPVGDAWVNVDHIVSVQGDGHGGTQIHTAGIIFFDVNTTIAQMMERIKEALS